MNLYDPSLKIRVIKLCADYKTILRTKKWEQLIENNPKVAIGHLVSILKPKPLKIKVENDLHLSEVYLQKAWRGFYQYIIEEAVSCEPFFPLALKGSVTRAS